MYATSSRSRSCSITISPISWLGISTRPLGRDVTLLRRLLEAGEQLVGIEVLTPAVLLDDEERHRLDPLVGREPLTALQALAPPANRLADFRVARVDDLQVVVTAVWTSHIDNTALRLYDLFGLIDAGCAGTRGCSGPRPPTRRRPVGSPPAVAGTPAAAASPVRRQAPPAGRLCGPCVRTRLRSP